MTPAPGSTPGARPSVAFSGHRWTRAPQQHVAADWELRAELEFWDRLLAEFADAPDETLALFREARAEVRAELDRRARLAYQRQDSPFADLGPVVEEVKRRADLLALFGSRLEWRGASSSGRRTVKFRCFLHDDSTPSLAVWPAEGRWWCFGCQHGGDAITAVMKLENLGFVHAVLALAAEYGVAVPERPRRGVLRVRSA